MHFPVANTIKEGESLLGYLSRIVISNNYVNLSAVTELLGFTRKNGGLNTSNIRNILAGNFDLQKLAELSESNIHHLVNAKFKLPPPKPGRETDEYISMKNWCVCPECLNEERGHQKFWQISFVTACPRHGKKLIEQCPSCREKLSIKNALSSKCKSCGEHLTSESAETSELSCSTAINKLLNSNNSKNQLHLEELLHRLMISMHLSSSNSLRNRYRLSPQLVPLNKMREILKTIWVAAESKKSLIQHISYLQKNIKDEWEYLPNAKSLLIDNIEKKGVLLKASKKLLDGKTPLFSKADPWLISTEKAAAALRISGFIIRRLIKSNLIHSTLFSETQSMSGATRLISLSELNSLIEKFFKASQPLDNYSGNKLSAVLNYDLSIIINEAISGKIDLYTDGSNQLSGLFIPFNQSVTFKKKDKKPNGIISAKEAASLLNIYHDAIADLIKRNILKTAPTNNKNRHLIHLKSVEEFKDKYLHVGSIAKINQLNPTNLSEKLTALNIHPISSPDIDGSLTSIYLRKDIEKLDWSLFYNLTSNSSKTGRKSTVDQNKITDVKVLNLHKLVEKAGSASNFAKKAHVSMGNLSMILHGKKSFGNLAAKRMEQRLSLEPGWFNIPR
ncbi:MAG: hypothetical protein HN868_18330 [Gammaproteobacteria bacterium]|jgi:hypothetical protein|nr:hypothetical protein [Gammaproteobacteria bacterium]MBT7209311.1 hypothetical protein [Gammaproteobacteria bacterium]